jgi:hypothetical protein
MTLTKTELIEKLTNIQQYLTGLENLNTERDNCLENLKKAKSRLEDTIQTPKSAIPLMIVFGIITGFLFYRPFDINSGFVLFLVRAGTVIFGLIAVYFLLLFLLSFIDIKPSRKKIITSQDQFDEIDEKLSLYISQNEQERNDINEFFPGDSCPLPRYIQYGINALTSGRADNFKEFMNLIDDLKHREKLESEAMAQTAYTRAAAANSAAALSAARRNTSWD